jgi:hypothetical protein
VKERNTFSFEKVLTPSETEKLCFTVSKQVAKAEAFAFDSWLRPEPHHLLKKVDENFSTRSAIIR